MSKLDVEKDWREITSHVNKVILHSIREYLEEQEIDEEDAAGVILNGLCAASGYYLFLGAQHPDHFYEGVTAYTKSLTNYGKQYIANYNKETKEWNFDK